MRQFSDPHLAALRGDWSRRVVRLDPGCRAVIPDSWVDGATRCCLASGLIFAGWARRVRRRRRQRNSGRCKYDLPLQLTDAVSLAGDRRRSGRRRQLPVELVYFWSLSASLQATITPDLWPELPKRLLLHLLRLPRRSRSSRPRCLLVFGCGSGRAARAAWRALCGLTPRVRGGRRGIADALTGGNYMYCGAKPVHNSLLSVIGPWPWYIAGDRAARTGDAAGAARLDRRHSPGRADATAAGRARARADPLSGSRARSRRCAGSPSARASTRCT